MTNTRAAIPQFAKFSSRRGSWQRSVALELALENRAIGRRIAELRERAHLTQPIAADRAGVSLRGYQKWEGGESRPNWANLEKLAEVFGVKPEEIVGQPSPREEITAGELEEIHRKLDEILKRLPPAQEPPSGPPPDEPIPGEPSSPTEPPDQEDTGEAAN